MCFKLSIQWLAWLLHSACSVSMEHRHSTLVGHVLWFGVLINLLQQVLQTLTWRLQNRIYVRAIAGNVHGCRCVTCNGLELCGLWQWIESDHFLVRSDHSVACMWLRAVKRLLQVLQCFAGWLAEIHVPSWSVLCKFTTVWGCKLAWSGEPHNRDLHSYYSMGLCRPTCTVV